MPNKPANEPAYGHNVTQDAVPGSTSFTAAAAVKAKADPLGDVHTSGDQQSGHGEDVRHVVRVNGQDYFVLLDDRSTVLDALREQIGLTGTKKGCDHGQCGACTIHLDGQRALSCLLLVVAVQGRDIKTIEGILSSNGDLHPMQQAFIDHDALQCGYCTSGQIMSAIACVEEAHADSVVEIQEFMSGNLCRCAAYPNIIAAIRQAKQAMGC